MRKRGKTGERRGTNDSSRVFKGRLTQWKLKGMDPPRLASDPGPKISTLQPSSRLVRALTYNLRWPSCQRYLKKILESGWFLDTLKSKKKLDKDDLEVLLLLGDCATKINDDDDGIISLFWEELAGKIPEEFEHAFYRVFQVPPKKLDLEAALVELGFTEILESVDRLQSKAEIEFYINRLTESQFKELQRKLGVSLSKPAMVAWTQPPKIPGALESKSPVIALPSDPPTFRNATSMMQWHLDYISTSNNATEAMHAKWLQMFDKGDLLMRLWTNISGDLIKTPQKVTGGRILVVFSNADAVTNDDAARQNLFYSKLHGEYVLSTEIPGLLRSEAGEAHAVFGNSLRAASVAFRRDNDYERAALCEKLEPVELLKNDLDRYLVAIGADLSIVDLVFAAESDVSGYEAIIWPAQVFYNPISRIQLMQVLAGNGFDRWGELAEPLYLPISLQGFDSGRGGGGGVFAAVKVNSLAHHDPTSIYIYTRDDEQC